MKFFLLLLFVPISIFAQTDQERFQKNKARVDSLLKRVDKATNDIKQIQQEENSRDADSLIKVIDGLALKLNENHTPADSAIVTTDTKHYYIVIGVYANQKLALQNKAFHKFNEADVVKSLKGKYYYLAIPCTDSTRLQKDVKKYRIKYKCPAWWVKL